jgi:argininosuccinate lyase
MQEDKEPLFDTADTVSQTLAVVAMMLTGITVHRDAMRKAAEDGFITATDLADYLVRKGLPFRQAHETVGRAVLRALELRCGLKDLTLAEYRKLSPLVGKDVYDALSVDASVRRRTSAGGTAPSNLKKRLEALKKQRSQRAEDSAGKR